MLADKMLNSVPVLCTLLYIVQREACQASGKASGSELAGMGEKYHS
jgi:hypothetical protein